MTANELFIDSNYGSTPEEREMNRLKLRSALISQTPSHTSRLSQVLNADILRLDLEVLASTVIQICI